ncbi:MAG TPA: Ig domain-containing protein [Candidatus Dormibacteraeota bacterium]|nr:Ig domain-containing protein [Candidatus Dormibacteraeota bacterium]
MSISRWVTRAIVLMAAFIAITGFSSNPAVASIAFGDLNNFDVFNDTGTDCHGFEIELDDIHSTDLTYTYDYNHYGAPKITEDNSDPAHPRVFVRYAATYDATMNGFSAYTAVPQTAPSPTDGHQCTNPSVNFGCEHFGVGYYGAPTVVRYNWLIENPSAPGTLIQGPAVNVSTPSWTYYPPAPAQVAQVQAVILAPPPPPAPVYEFGDAVWVKSIITTSHNNQAVELRDLVSDDPADPTDKNWANGEPDEVEVEWRILQTEFKNVAGANNELAGGIEDLPNGDEVITRRYEFYKYAGPLDPETNEAKCDNYPQISDPADPKYKPECDPAAGTVVLGDYIGAQMAGFNVEAALGLIDHIQDGDLDQLYTTRTVVIGGNTPYVTSVASGALPDGLALDSATGVLSGTPTAAGVFTFTVTATDADAVGATKAYTMRINDPAGVPVDNCPGDPAKTEPGLCGCGVADTDSDGDGTPDCHDQCANDATKVAPGVCGCGVSDVDSDGDGTPDCQDQCANDPTKVAPGACGCGVADTDSNGNGIADCLEPKADLLSNLQTKVKQAKVGRRIAYQLQVMNNGPAAATSAMAGFACSGVAYHVVATSSGCATSGGSVSCSLGTLGIGTGGKRKVTIVPDAAGTLSCTATASSAALDPDPTNDSTTLPIPVL